MKVCFTTMAAFLPAFSTKVLTQGNPSVNLTVAPLGRQGSFPPDLTVLQLRGRASVV